MKNDLDQQTFDLFAEQMHAEVAKQVSGYLRYRKKITGLEPAAWGEAHARRGQNA